MEIYQKNLSLYERLAPAFVEVLLQEDPYFDWTSLIFGE